MPQSLITGKLQHECTLLPPDDIIVKYIDSGFFVDFRRTFRRFFTVSEKSHFCRLYLRSTAMIRQEKKRHLQQHYYMIHPFSKGRSYWERFMVFTLFAILIIIPIENAVPVMKWSGEIPHLTLDFFCCVDIVVNFFCGYYDENARKVILNPKKVAKHYLSTYFLIDLVSSVPLDYITHYTYPELAGNRYIDMLDAFKILRIPSLLTYLERIRIRRNKSMHVFKLIKLLMMFIIALIWVASFIHLFFGNDDKEKEDRTLVFLLLKSGYRALYKFFLMGLGGERPESTTQMLFLVVCLQAGLILEWFIYAQTYQFLTRNFSSSTTYHALVSQVHEYMSYKHLPELLKKRILMYFEYRFQKSYFKEEEILNTLSDNLREDIIIYSCQNLVQNVELFRGMPPMLLLQIAKCMRSEIFLTNDVIVRAGVHGNSMYFIASGTVAVYTSAGKEICHLSDGGHFGEIALIMENEKRVASVVAVECCELFNLSRKDFRKAIDPYPEFNKRLRDLVQQRLKSTIRFMSLDL